MIRPLAFAMAASLLLAACSGGNQSGNQGGSLIREGIDAIRGGISAARSGPPAEPQLSRALLDGIDAALMRVRVEKTGLTAILTRTTEIPDPYPGTVSVWRSGDSATLSFREGLLIATRALGGDIISSDVDATRRALASGGGTALRVHHIRALDNKAVRMDFACAIAPRGAETITIVERRFTTARFTETCTTESGRINNSYWLARDGTILKSRQWAGPEIGYLRTERLNL